MRPVSIPIRDHVDVGGRLPRVARPRQFPGSITTRLLEEFFDRMHQSLLNKLHQRNEGGGGGGGGG